MGRAAPQSSEKSEALSTEVRTGVTETVYDAIEQRKRPPVAGIDLEQALNYVRANPVGLELFYHAFTQPVTFYQRGSRPALERFVDEQLDADAPQAARLAQLVEKVAQAVPHHVHFPDELPADGALSEEQLITQGRGWCNEQARVMVALAQAAGIPARMLFVRYHTICEAHVDGKWVSIDQSFAHVFQTSGGRLLNVLDIRSDEQLAEDANVVYRDRIAEARESVRQNVGPARAEDRMFRHWAGSDEPIRILETAGYYNYFIH